MGTKWEQQDTGGVGGSSADRNSIYGKGRRGEERKKRVNREKTHFGRDQGDFGVYLYE